MSKKFFYVLFYVFVFCKLLPTVFADRQYYDMDAIVKADTSSGMGGSVIDVKEIDRRVNAFASIVGEEDFVLKVGGTLLARSAFYGQQRDVASDVDQSLSVGTEMAAGFAMGKVLKVGKRLGTALVKGESTLAKAIVAKIAERSGHVHKNSLAYRGDTHVYKIIGEDGIHKIGESAQGLNKSHQSIRATQQARNLERQTGQRFKRDIIRTFDGKWEA